VNQPAGHVQAEAQQPENQKYNDNGPEHINLLVLFLSYFFSFKRNRAERLPALQANSLGAWRDQPAIRAHSLQSNLWDLRFKPRQQRSQEFPCQGKTAAERRTVRFHSNNTIAEWLGRLSQASDTLTMTGKARDFCAGLLTSPGFFHPPCGAVDLRR
jgi:hypothetical protein